MSADTSFNTGHTGISQQFTIYHAWAIVDDDIGAVPIPIAVRLFGSDLIGLIGYARRKTTWLVKSSISY